MKRYTRPLFLLFGLVSFTLFINQRTSTAAGCRPDENQYACDQQLPSPTFTVPGPRLNSVISGVEYGWIDDYARFYEAPDFDSRRVRYATVGMFYGPVAETVTDREGNRWRKIWDEWLPDKHFHPVQPSNFTGLEVNEQPDRPFGWVMHEYEPHSAPNEDEHAGFTPLQRYEFVQIYDATIGDDGAVWYDVGDGRWVRYHALALVTLRERPWGIESNEYWVDVDLTQQTFAAYEGDRMVFTGIISSGLPRWPTRRGVFKVWLRYEKTDMSGGKVGDDYYYLEDVPHTLYFDGAIALHGAYWHDEFGKPRSHGCVNLPPRAAEWIFYWSEKGPGELRVWVHYSRYTDFLHEVEMDT